MHCNNHIFWHADLTCSYIPSKQTRAAQRRFGVRNGLMEREVKRMDSGHNLGQEDEPVRHSDRKPRAVPDKSYAYNIPRFEVAHISTVLSPKPKLAATPVQLLKFLMSDAALQFCLPTSEFETMQNRSAGTITYANLLSPFEELLCAVIISRPIPHQLSLQIIRTILNAPYEFRNPVAIKTAGPRRIAKALNVARTPQTAQELDFLVDIIASNNWHNDLSKLRAQAKRGSDPEREVLRRSIRGLGRTGLDIFYRRVQWQWDEAYASVDTRALRVLGKLDMPKRAEGIAKMIEVRWTELRFEEGRREFDVEEKRRRAFVVLLERLVGADMDGRLDEVVEEAARL
jgi:hypothetical protein